MDQSELANPAIVVVTPNLPHFVVGGSGDSNDLAALARLVMFVPHRGRPEELRFGEGTWSKSLPAAQLAGKYKEGQEGSFIKAKNILKAEFAANPTCDIVELNWLDMARLFDPHLCTRTGYGAGARYCGNCGATHATKKCSLCRTVYYCSVDCQKCSWWHHKATSCLGGSMHG